MKLYKLIKKEANIVTLALIMYLLLAVFAIRNTLLAPGFIGYWFEHYIPPYSEQIRQWAFECLYSWFPPNFGIPLLGAAIVPVVFFISLLSYLNLSAEVIIKFLILMGIFIPSISMFFLARQLRLKILPSWLAGIFYATTPPLYNGLAAGHLPWVIAYALTPLSIMFFIRPTKNQAFDWRNSLLAGLTFAFVLQPQFFVFTVIILIIYTFVFKNEVYHESLTAFVMLATCILIHAFWIIPLVARAHQLLYEYGSFISGDLKFEIALSLTKRGILNAIRMTKCEVPLFTSSLSGLSNLTYLLWIFAHFGTLFLVFTCISFGKLVRRDTVLFLSILSIIGIFFLSGVQPSLIFFKSVLWRVLFKINYHFSFIVAFSYALLLGASIRAILSWFNKQKGIIILGIAILFFINALPFYQSGNFEGYLEPVILPHEYRRVYKDLLSQRGDFRIVWLPMGLRNVGYKGRKSKRLSGIDPFITESPKPSVGNWLAHNPYTLYFSNLFYENTTGHLGKILSLGTFKYVVLRKSFYSTRPGFTQENALKVLLDQANLVEVENYGDGEIIVFENKRFLPHIYASTLRKQD